MRKKDHAQHESLKWGLHALLVVIAEITDGLRPMARGSAQPELGMPGHQCREYRSAQAGLHRLGKPLGCFAGAVAAGANDYIMKPFDAGAIRAKLADIGVTV